MQNAQFATRRLTSTVAHADQALKVSWNCWDIGDLVAHIYRQVKGDRWAGPPIHAILADEVQDFSQAECALMIEISADTNRLFFSGDTAQTISR